MIPRATTLDHFFHVHAEQADVMRGKCMARLRLVASFSAKRFK